MSDEFHDLFERAAPTPATPTDTARALERSRPGFERARRHHRIRNGMAAAAMSVLVVGGAVALVGPGRSTDVQTDPADPTPSADDLPPDDAGPPPADDLTSGETTLPAPEDPTAAAPDPAADPSAGTVATTSAAPPTTSAPTISTTTAPPPTTTAEPEAPATETATTPGGSITVSHDGSTVTIESIDPEPGFTPDLTEDDPTEIKIYFRSADAEYEIEIHLEGGQLVVETET